MQSYMNSLNESANMEMDSSPVRETPPTPEDCSSKEAIGAISRAYRNIFSTSSDGGSQERPAKMANLSTDNNNSSSFSQDASFLHPNSTQSYQSCPVAPAALCPVSSSDNKQAFHNVDNSSYAFPGSTNNNYEQPHSTTNLRGTSGDYNSYHSAENTPNQLSCPWKLAPGSKVLVRNPTQTKPYEDSCEIACKTDLFAYCPSLRPAPSMPGLCQDRSVQVRRYGNLSPSASPQQ